MILHYLLTAWRNLWKNKTHSFIHFLGLSVALITAILIGTYVIHELQFDKFHKKGKNLYRLNANLKLPDQEVELALASGIMAPNLKNNFPEVEAFCRLASPWSDMVFSHNNRTFFEKNILYADESFFEMFDFPLMQGNPSEVLQQPNQVVLTQKIASKYFGKQNPVGESLSINDELFTITGVAKNPPENSHIKFDGLITYKNWVKEHPAAETNWTWINSPTYLLLHKNADHLSLNTRLDEWIASKLSEDEEMAVHLSLQAFESIHFSPMLLGELHPKGSKVQLLLLSIIGLLVLFMALFNYVNLATALYSSRIKEIGVRKTLGANKSQLIFQFLAESTLLAAMALFCSFLLLNLILPWFNDLIGKNLSFDFINPLSVVLLFLTLVGVIGGLAGIYPSLIVSNWQPIQLFRGKKIKKENPFSFKHVLIGFQFIISIGLIITTLIIWQQYQFLTKKDLGFEQDNKMILELGQVANLQVSGEALKKELQQLPEVQRLAFSSHIPSEYTHGLYTQIVNEKGENKEAEMELNLIDADFLDVYGLQLIRGQNFSAEMANDTIGRLIVNEAVVQQMGFETAESIIGRDFFQWGRRGKVIGVVKDFNQHSLHTAASPMTFQMNPSMFEKITLHFQTKNLPAFISQLEAIWHQLNPNVPFQYSFLEERLSLQYEAEKRFSSIFLTFTLLAILIACLGLYGLLGITLAQRLKEIGIRKVLGAGFGDILLLLSKDYFRLILVTLLIASPIAWLLLNKWLDGFAYRISIEWWIFVLAGLSVIGIVFLTVSFQSTRAAFINPVESLRTE